MLDAAYPGSVTLQKVIYKASEEWQRITNLKMVQAILTKNGVDRFVDVERIARAKAQDNLEFLQWFKAWFDGVYDY